MAKRKMRVWAVVNSRGKIVRNEKGAGLLIYDRKWRAEGMKWKPGERVAQMNIQQRPTP